MKLGVVARADNRGLGIQSLEVARHMNPERVLVVREPGSEKQGFEPHLDWYPNGTVVTDETGVLPIGVVKEWLDGLDVVYSAETLYDVRFTEWARELRVATIIHTNAEFHRPDRPAPTVWWAATNWRLDQLPEDTRLVPMPVPIDRWPTVNHDARTVLHVGGRAATRDRNGTEIVFEVAKELPSVDFVITSQTRMPSMRKGKRHHNVHLAPSPENYWDLYTDHAVLLQPRRYGGLCLPANEAAGAGLALVMPDVTPNRWWPITPVPAREAPPLKLQMLTIGVDDTYPHNNVEALREVLSDLPAHRGRSREWAESHSWEAMRPLWDRALEHAAGSIPPRKVQNVQLAPVKKTERVSLIVPFVPDGAERDRNWAFLRKWWQNHDFEIIEGRCDGPWRKGIAVAEAVEKSSGEILIIADADVMPHEDAIADALSRVGETWIVPHTTVHRLSDDTTTHLINHGTLPDSIVRARGKYIGIAGGGCVVLTRDMWDACPIDTRFEGWGEEDKSWGFALDTLIAPHERLGHDLFHLWHPPQKPVRQSSEQSIALGSRYDMARGAPRIMAALVAQQEPEPVDPLPIPVNFHTERSSLVIRMGNTRVKFREGAFSTTDPDLADQLRRRPDVREVTC